MKAQQLSKIALALATTLSLSTSATADIKNPQIIESNGKQMFSIYYINQEIKTNGYFSWDYYPNETIQQAIADGVRYWADILSPYSVNTTSIPIYVGTCTDQNAYAWSLNLKYDTGGAFATNISKLYQDKGSFLSYDSVIQYTQGNLDIDKHISEYFFNITVGQNKGLNDPSNPTNYGWTIDTNSLLENKDGQTNLVSVIRHEMGHALGINTPTINLSSEDESGNLVIRDDIKKVFGITSEFPEVDLEITDRGYDFSACADYRGKVVLANIKRTYAAGGSKVRRALIYISENFGTPDSHQYKNIYALAPIAISSSNDFGAHLYDLNGKQAQNGDIVIPEELYNKLGNDADKSKFFVLNPQTYDKPYGAYFSGKNVKEVLNGAKLAFFGDKTAEGLPVNGWEINERYLVSVPELSHINLNGMMSHITYFNVTTFFEAELAVMQDLGYQFDRKNYYGFSEYRDGQSYENFNGYFARNEEGTDWIVGEPNKTSLAVGFDVYGSNNTITQMADLLSVGTGSAGIRVNGTGNNITIANGVNVKSDGYNGMGVLFSAGVGQSLTVNGNVSAQGENGNALVFDFGSNAAGPWFYRGSYIAYYRDVDTSGQMSPNYSYNILDASYSFFAPECFKGPLMNKVSISGNVIGNKNAIYISKNAFVKELEFTDSANITGNLSSEWKDGFGDVTDDSNIYYNLALQYDDNTINPASYVPGLVTDINFKGSNVHYTGAINAAKNSRLNISSGTATISKLKDTDSVSTLSVNIADNANAITNQDYNLTLKSSLTPDSNYQNEFDADESLGCFTNSGTLTIGTAQGGIANVSITGNYIQKDSGTLEMRVGVDNDSHSTLTVTAHKTDSSSSTTRSLLRASTASNDGVAQLGGTLAISPVGDGYYNPDSTYRYTLGDFVKADSLDSSLKAVVLNTPTLSSKVITTNAQGNSISLLSDSTDVITFGYERDYAQYAKDSNASSLAKALENTNPNLGSSMERLYTAIDFLPDGKAVSSALNSLKPSLYEELTQSIFTSQKQNLSFREDSILKSSLLGNGIYTRVQPFGMHESRQGKGVGYRANNVGVIAEFDKVEDANVYGMYAVFNKKELKAKDKQSSASDYSLYAGIDTLLRPFANSFFITSDLGLGFDSIETKRNVSFNGYAASADKKYTALGAYLSLGTGYDFNLSSITLTPFIKLNYNMLHQGKVKENGDDGIELSLDSKTFKSMSSSVGLRAQSKELMADDVAITLSGSIAYNYELLNHYGTLKASFRQAPNSSFDYDVKPYKDSSFEAMGSIKFSKANFSFSTDLGLENYQGSGTDSFARLNFGYSF